MEKVKLAADVAEKYDLVGAESPAVHTVAHGKVVFGDLNLDTADYLHKYGFPYLKLKAKKASDEAPVKKT